MNRSELYRNDDEVNYEKKRQDIFKMDRKPNYYGVHDGYATIRSRGRPRSHAISRTNGKDFPRRPTKAYEVPSVAKSCIILNEFPQVPRWSDSGVHGTLIENYNTLKAGVKRCNLVEPHETRTLNTFASRSNQGRRNSFKAYRHDDDTVRAALNATIQNESTERKRTLLVDNPIKDIRNHIYDTVPVELNYADDPPLSSYCRLKNTFPEGNWKNRMQKLENSVQAPPVKSKRTEQLNNSNRSTKYCKSQGDQFSKASAKADRVPLANQNRKINGTKDKQPIYAIPNIYSKPNRDRKYIEDINRNIAEIDESYESLKASPASKNATYGVINKIAKGDLLDRKFYGYQRKRDMAPMPSIGSGLIENIEERMEKVSNVETQSKEILDTTEHVDQTINESMIPKIHQTPIRSTVSIESIKESPMEHLKDEDTNDATKSNNRKSINIEKRRAYSECDSQNRIPSIDDDKRTRCRSIDLLEIDSVRTLDRHAHDKLHLNEEDALPSLNGSANYRRTTGLAGKKCLSNQQLSRRSESSYLEKKCDTLPYRRSTVSPRLGYKSGGDVLDSASYGYIKSATLQRSCMSVDEIAYNRGNAFGDKFQEDSDTSHRPMYLMDATDVILEGQLKRAGSIQSQVYPHRSNYPGTKYSTLRAEKHDIGNSDVYQCHGFSTLPRQAALLKPETNSKNVRQFSRNILFEPLYEHAVSDLVKLRDRKSAIPWWELATRKYRHRSCPSLQVKCLPEPKLEQMPCSH